MAKFGGAHEALRRLGRATPRAGVDFLRATTEIKEGLLHLGRFASVCRGACACGTREVCHKKEGRPHRGGFALHRVPALCGRRLTHAVMRNPHLSTSPNLPPLRYHASVCFTLPGVLRLRSSRYTPTLRCHTLPGCPLAYELPPPLAFTASDTSARLSLKCLKFKGSQPTVYVCVRVRVCVLRLRAGCPVRPTAVRLLFRL